MNFYQLMSDRRWGGTGNWEEGLKGVFASHFPQRTAPEMKGVRGQPARGIEGGLSFFNFRVRADHSRK